MLHSLSDGRTRHIFYRLYAHPAPLTDQDLAAWLTGDQQDIPLVELTPTDIRAIRMELTHSHLPQLEEADLIEWERRTGNIRTTNHPVLSNPKLRKILNVDADNWDNVICALATRRNRVILRILRDTEREFSRKDLADRLANHTHSAEETRALDTDSLSMVLHHKHLPALKRAGLINYDAETDQLSYSGHPELEDNWIDVWAAEHTTSPSLPPSNTSPSMRG